MTSLKPFFSYYGGKYRAARLYPAPEHDTVIEPFAGSAGYSLRYADRRVILVDKNPIVCSVWRYLIATSGEEILKLPDIPDGGTVDDLPVCQEVRWLAGFWCNKGNTHPCKKLSTFAKVANKKGHVGGWADPIRRRIARQVDQIRHWIIIEDDYMMSPDMEATWFVDPPYKNQAGNLYPFQPENFDELAAWCRSRQGLVVVCENDGATWLPFQKLATIKNTKSTGSKEVIWMNKEPRFYSGVQINMFDAGENA